MAFDYEGLRVDTVLPLMEEFGFVATITKQDSTDNWEKKFDEELSRVYYENIVTGDIVYSLPNGTTEVELTIIWSSIEQKEINNTTILSTDEVIYVSPKGVQINIGEYITIESKKYRVQATKPIKQAGVELLNRVFLRK